MHIERCTDMSIPALFHDVRYAMRDLRKSFGFSLTAILMFALGIGVNSAIFSPTYAILLKNLPVPNPEELIRYTFKKGEMDIGLSWPMYDSIRKNQSAAADVLAWSSTVFVLGESGSKEQVHGGMLTGNGFAVLGIRPSVGRLFSTSDDITGGGSEGYKAVLGYEFWQHQFHADPKIVGRRIVLNDTPVSVIGVLPKGSEVIEANHRVDIVVPLTFVSIVHPQKNPPYRDAPGNFWLTVLGRLRPGQTLNSARANLSAVRGTVLQQAGPNGILLKGFFKGFVLGVESGSGGRSELRPAYSQPLRLLEALSAFILVLCCTNIGLLMLARVTERRVEFALRAALGASSGRLTAHILLEVALLAFPGLVAGIAAGSALARVLAAMLGHIGDPPTLDVSGNVAVIVFSTFATIASAVVAALGAAVNIRRNGPGIDLKQTIYSATRKTSGAWVVAVQVAASIVLLVCALLFSSTFTRLYLQPSGFDGKHLVFGDISVPREKTTPDETERLAANILRQLQSAPGIKSAALMSMPPLRGWISGTRLFAFDSHGTEHADSEIWPEAVSGAYFETVGTHILEGRALRNSDVHGEKVCVLSRSAAHFFFPGEDAIGRLVYRRQGDRGEDAPNKENARRVVGVAEDAHFFSLRKKPDHVVYTPLEKADLAEAIFEIGVRASDVTIAIEELRQIFHTTVADAAPPVIYTYSQLLDDQLQRERMLVSVSAAFGAIAMVFVAVGLFGILMRSVTQQTREIGIRLALGERRSSILRVVLASTMKQVTVGATIGIVLAVVTGRVVKTLLFETSASSPWVYVLAVFGLFVVATCAALLPATRAVSIEPLGALRSE